MLCINVFYPCTHLVPGQMTRYGGGGIILQLWNSPSLSLTKMSEYGEVNPHPMHAMLAPLVMTQSPGFYDEIHRLCLLQHSLYDLK